VQLLTNVFLPGLNLNADLERPQRRLSEENRQRHRRVEQYVESRHRQSGTWIRDCCRLVSSKVTRRTYSHRLAAECRHRHTRPSTSRKMRQCSVIYSAGCLLRRATSITTTSSTRRVCGTFVHTSSANRLCMDNAGFVEYADRPNCRVGLNNACS